MYHFMCRHQNCLAKQCIETFKVSFSDADSDDLESLGAFAVASFKPQPGKKRKNESSKEGQKNPKQGKYKRNGYIYSNMEGSLWNLEYRFIIKIKYRQDAKFS